MQYSEKDLIAEIEQIILNDSDFPQSWVATKVMNNHPLLTTLEGRDGEFAQLCCWAHVLVVIRSVNRRLHPNENEETLQGNLVPGFKRLQRKYSVMRDGEPWYVRIETMTDHEFDIKRAEYMTIGRGCYEHADELLRYKEKRAGQKPA